MKKVILGVAGIALLAVVGLLGAASMQPSEITVVRSATVNATPADIAAHVTDYKAFVKWSPWTGLDEDQKVSFSDPATGKDAWYTWKGEVTGEGKMTIMAIAPEKIDHKLEFFAPFESVASTSFLMAPKGEATELTWDFKQDADFMTKVMTLLFLDMDAELGPDYEKGLVSLKAASEKSATLRIEAEKAKAAEAQAALDAENLADKIAVP